MAFTVADINLEVRFNLGGLSTAVMSDVLMDDIINRDLVDHSLEDEDKCIVTYHSLLDVLRYLIRQGAAASGATGGGEIIERSEKNGGREAKVKYAAGTSSGDNGYQTLLDDFLANPQYVCASLVTETTKKAGSVIFGGADHNAYEHYGSAYCPNPFGQEASIRNKTKGWL